MSLQPNLVHTPAIKHPALLSFAALWLAAAGVIAAKGELMALGFQAGFLLIFLMLAVLTVRLTPPTPAPTPAQNRGPAIPIAICLALAVNVVPPMAFHGIIPVNWHPTATTMMWLNPTLMVIVPGAILLALGLKFAHLGLDKGRRPWLIGLLWSTPFFILTVISLAVTGQPGPVTILRRAFSDLLQNGFSEEFIWRGVLQTALERRLGGEWGLVLASLLFGLWHLPANLASFGGDFLAAFAFSILSQGLMGMAFGFIYRRTGNLIAPTLFHIATHMV